MALDYYHEIKRAHIAVAQFCVRYLFIKLLSVATI